MTTLLIISVVLACLLQGVPLIKKKMWKELTAAGFILLVAIFLQISKNLGMITPIDLLQKLFEPIGKLYLNQL